MKRLFLFFFIVASIFTQFFYSCKILKPIPQAERVGVKLNYAFNTNNWLNYKQNHQIDQSINFNNQDIKVTIGQVTDFMVHATWEDAKRIKLGVKLNSLDFMVNTQGQEIKPDLSNLKGNEFGFSISKYGKEMDLQEADNIIFEIVPSEKANLTSIFQGIFPDLPEGVIRKGGSWNSGDTVLYNDGTRSSEMIMNYTHSLNGFTEMDGLACAEINSVIMGSIHVKSASQGMEMETNATVTGKSTWYFAFDKGIFVRESTTGTSDGAVKTPMGEMALKRNFTIETKLIY